MYFEVHRQTSFHRSLGKVRRVLKQLYFCYCLKSTVLLAATSATGYPVKMHMDETGVWSP